MIMKDAPAVGLTGYTWTTSVTQKDIDAIKSYEKPIEEIHKYQPDTTYFESTAGNEVWRTYTYTRHAETFGPGVVKATLS